MFISPGEIERGQWLMVHSSKTNATFKDSQEESNPLASLLFLAPQQEPAIPHMVLCVQLPFVAVSDCSTSPCISRIWRTDEKNFMEVSSDFVKSVDQLAWRRGQIILDAPHQNTLSSPKKSV